MNYQKDGAEYRSGAQVIGPETETMERLELAKLAPELRRSVEIVDEEEDRAPESRIYDDAGDILRAWAGYRLNGAEPVGRVLPEDLSKPGAMVGMALSMQAATFVEETEGYRDVEASLRSLYGLPWPYERIPWSSLTVEEFTARVQDRLPYEFLAPRRELCEAEMEQIEKAAEAARQAVIDDRHKRRAPGMAKIFKGFNEDWKKNEEIRAA